MECFTKFSGLKLNEEKTEFFRLGVYNLSESFHHEFKLSIQILGVHFDCDEFSGEKANFEAILKLIKKEIKYVEMERKNEEECKLANHLPFLNLCPKPPLFMFQIISYR